MGIRSCVAVLVLCLDIVNFAHAVDVVGMYYTELTPLDQPNEYRPEMLYILKPDKTYEVRTVHSGKQEIYRGQYTLKDDQLVLLRGTYINPCPEVEYDDDSDAAITAKVISRTPTALTILNEGENVVLPVATVAQIQQVMTLPLCE